MAIKSCPRCGRWGGHWPDCILLRQKRELKKVLEAEVVEEGEPEHWELNLAADKFAKDLRGFREWMRKAFGWRKSNDRT